MSGEARQCVCCGLGPAMYEADGPCGHAFCCICVGRGHDEDCVACEYGADDHDAVAAAVDALKVAKRGVV